MASLAILASHPIQYHAPLFRELARRLDLHVFYAHRATPQDQARAGFGTAFDWDVDLLSGYAHDFLANQARVPGTDHFFGCDTPQIYEALRDGKFDALLVSGWHLKSFLQGVFAAKRLGMPVMVRGDSQLGTPRSGAKILAKQVLYPAALKLFDAALYVGQRSRAYYAHYRYPAERLFFSPHCVDTDWFSTRATAVAREQLRARYGIAAETRLLLFAGKLVPFKRPQDLVAAAALLRRQDARIALLVAGDGVLSSALRHEAAALGVPLHGMGFCNQSEMPAIYAAADVLILPSDARETWGLVVNEALACGRPVVVSDACGCAPDLAADKMAGRIFPMGDVAAMAAATHDILAKPPGRERIAEKSARYSLGAAADGIGGALEFCRPRHGRHHPAEAQ